MRPSQERSRGSLRSQGRPTANYRPSSLRTVAHPWTAVGEWGPDAPSSFPLLSPPGRSGPPCPGVPSSNSARPQLSLALPSGPAVPTLRAGLELSPRKLVSRRRAWAFVWGLQLHAKGLKGEGGLVSSLPSSWLFQPKCDF